MHQQSSKDFVISTLLCFFLGVFGAHRFYVVITGGGFGVWYLIDLIRLLMGNFTDGDGLPIKN